MKIDFKYNTLIILLLVSVSILSSCEDRLEEELLDASTPSEAFGTPDAGETGLNGIIIDWGRSSLFGRDWIYIVSFRSDDHLLGRDGRNQDRTELFNSDINPTNGLVFNIYRGLYQSIDNSNLLLDGIQEVVYSNERLRQQYIAEAKFYRAFSYYHLVRLYGRLILYTDPIQKLDANITPRSSIDDIYDLIIQDLTDAIEHLPESGNSRNPEGPSKTAAQAYLASVHLTRENWDEAASFANDVIESGAHQLEPNFADIFSINNEGSNEHIFSIREEAGTPAFAWPFWWGAYNPGGNKLPHTMELRDAFSSEDSRFLQTFKENHGSVIFDARTVEEANLISNKWFDDGGGDRDWIAMRYAEVLLIYAEAVNEGGGERSITKESALNMVRSRAGLPEITNLDQAAFRDAVRLERRLELAFEGKRSYDLLRYGDWVSALQARSSTRGLGHNVTIEDALLPIPQAEIDLNPALEGDQNPGY